MNTLSLLGPALQLLHILKSARFTSMRPFPFLPRFCGTEVGRQDIMDALQSCVALGRRGGRKGGGEGGEELGEGEGVEGWSRGDDIIVFELFHLSMLAMQA